MSNIFVEGTYYFGRHPFCASRLRGVLKPSAWTMLAALALPIGPGWAALPSAPRLQTPAGNPTVERLLNEAQTAIAAGQINQALIDLKLAAGMEPNNPAVAAKLGI